jgi:hypothetical protein
MPAGRLDQTEPAGRGRIHHVEAFQNVDSVSTAPRWHHLARSFLGLSRIGLCAALPKPEAIVASAMRHDAEWLAPSTTALRRPSRDKCRGVNGGGLPWQIAGGRGRLGSDGRLDVQVHGLVLLNGPPVAPALQGTNPNSSFRAIVSCLTIINGSPSTANVATGPFPATATGHSQIEASVALPSPCIAPVIFVGPSPTTWFAVTGTS